MFASLSERFFIVICISLSVSQIAVKIVDNCYALNFAKLLEKFLTSVLFNIKYVLRVLLDSKT